MHYYLILFQLAFFSLNAADFRVTNITKEATLTVSASEGGYHFLSQQKDKKSKLKKAVSFGFKPITVVEGKNAISFEVQGDGSQFYASVFLGNSKYLTSQYEALFPLHSREWQKIVIPFSTFCWNYKSLNPESFDFNKLKDSLEADYISMIGFGRGFKFHRFPHPDYSFKIRNIEFTTVKEKEDLPFKKGIAETKKKIAENKDLKVLLIGDSITESGRQNSHTAHAFRSLNYSGQAEIVNAAIGGHTARAASIILPRTVAKMPNPDLIVIFLGANDCNTLSRKPDLSEGIFEYQLMSLMTRVNNLTGGQSEFLLVNGMPRINRDDMKSVGKVETISGAYDRLNEKYGFEFVDTMSIFNSLSADEIKVYYNDTIHPKQEGQKFIGKHIAEKLK